MEPAPANDDNGNGETSQKSNAATELQHHDHNHAKTPCRALGVFDGRSSVGYMVRFKAGNHCLKNERETMFYTYFLISNGCIWK